MEFWAYILSLHTPLPPTQHYLFKNCLYFYPGHLISPGIGILRKRKMFV